MLETPHVMVGAAIAIKVGNPLLAVPLAFVSHFALEKIPHWNPHINTEFRKYGRVTKKSTMIAAADASLALLVGSTMAYNALPNTALAFNILACSFASVLPDLIEAPYFFLNIRSNFLKKWVAFQKSLQVDATPFWGILTQIIAVVTTVLWLQS